MKALVYIFLFMGAFCSAQELSQLRMQYPKANDNEVATNELEEKLASVSKEKNTILSAYKGAILTLKAKFAKGIGNKKSYFKEGAELIEYAIKTKPSNIELRCIRLGVQENSPRITGYKKNISEDKDFILKNYHTTTNAEVKKFVKGYVIISDAFSGAEKQLF